MSGPELTRRQILAAAGGAVAAGVAGRLGSAGEEKPAAVDPAVNSIEERRKLKSVPATLLPGRHLDQVNQTRETYLSIPDDDMLFGFRKHAKLATPGNAMTGWCGDESSVIFGQVVSGLARMSSYLRDPALAEKAVRLHEGWLKTVGDDGNPHTGTYGFDKFACGMVDLKSFVGYDSVGTIVNVEHVGGAPLGATVTFQAQIESVEGRRVNFRVAAWAGQHKIGEGTHQRFVVTVARFAEKMLAKLGTKA